MGPAPLISLKVKVKESKVMQGEFTFFWSVLIPAVMVIGSVIITYVLYRHFASKMHERQEKQTEQS